MDTRHLDYLDAYKKMLTIRLFEQKVAFFFSRAMIHGTTHLCIGQEAAAVGAVSALEKEDHFFPTHRGHGHCIARGIDLNRMMSELMGKESGFCRGRGGSMHIADAENGNMGSNGIVGGSIPISVGAALTAKMKKIKRIVLCFFGDGAINEGTFHESLNLASIWNLPIVFICENNQFGMSMSAKRSSNVKDLSVRAASYGIPGETVDGNDVSAVFDAVSRARKHALENGPVLVVAETYRFTGHSKSDANRYRTREEIEEKKKYDPVSRMRTLLLEQGIATEDQIQEIDKETAGEIEKAVAFAEASPEPSLEGITDNVYETIGGIQA